MRYSQTLTILALALLLFIGGSLVSTESQAQQPLTEGNFVFVNYIGQEMTFDLDDVTHHVPGTDTVSDGGRLVLTLAAGEHKFAANVPGGPRGFAGEFTIVSGEVVAKAARIEQTGPVVRNGKLLVAPQDFVAVFDYNPAPPPAVEMPVVDTWQPTPASAGQGSLVLVNHIGRELTFDLNGQLYKVPAPTNTIPGRLQIGVNPGFHRYTASVPAGSLNREITVVAGQVTALNFTADPPEPLKYKVGEEFEVLQPVIMRLFAEDITAQAVMAETTPPLALEDQAPQILPETGGVVILPAIDDGLLVKNYAGDTLTLTINQQVYTIPDGAEYRLALPPGLYSYTASRPGLATTGLVDLAVGQSLELSIAINVAHDFLNVYETWR